MFFNTKHAQAALGSMPLGMPLASVGEGVLVGGSYYISSMFSILLVLLRMMFIFVLYETIPGIGEYVAFCPVPEIQGFRSSRFEMNPKNRWRLASCYTIIKVAVLLQFV